MEKLIRDRDLVRSKFVTLALTIVDELAKEGYVILDVKAKFAQMERRFVKLDKLNDKIIAALEIEGDQDEQAYESEFNQAEDDRDRMDRCRVLVEHSVINASKTTEDVDVSVSQMGSPSLKRKFKLPKLEWKTFSGDPKDWLGFWGQFSKIDENASIENADKFQYLLQAVEKGSRAGELVGSFPPSASCYPRAIESLKNRFGRDDILVEIYVRELLRLVLQNAMNIRRYVVSFGGVLLPEDVMRAWERSRVQLTSATTLGGVTSVNQLTLLMSFLQTEVEGEERISMARKGFGIEKEDRVKKMKSKVDEISDEIPTAAGLFVGNKEQKKKPCCIFCGKNNHMSHNCFKARNMSIDEKTKCAGSKKCCFDCLKFGHRSRDCDANIKCKKCNNRHYEVMCRKVEHSKGESCGGDSKKVTTEENLVSESCMAEVLMQTLLVRLLHNDKELVVRAVLDSGSQRSYLREDAARAIGYSSVGEERVRHSLFGGSKSDVRVHQKYQIRVASMDKKYICNFLVLDEESICGNLPVARSGPWMDEVKRLGIPITDCGSDRRDIQLLIGVDVCKRLETGQKFDFVCGPSAVETRLGWTLCGKAMGQESKHDSSLLVTNLFVREAEVQDLWRLDTIGITDPAENKSREELQQAAMDYFLDTVKKDADGRYEVSLPWIAGHRDLPSNKILAEKRLRSATKKIRSEGVMESYQKIFDDWEEEGIIEEVPPEEVSAFGHYLPHRAVLKANSETTPVRPVFDASAKEKFSPSLNDCLEKGPNLLELIPDVVTRFRLEKIGVVADIKKAFLQISVRSEDRNYLRFLWWEGSGKDGKLMQSGASGVVPQEGRIKEYRHRRVVFGVSSSPFLLGATINFHLEKAPEEFQDTAKKLKSSFYVDNCVTSLGSQEEVQKFVRESTKLMSTAKFDLRGWMTSLDCERQSFPVLGLTWDLVGDSLCCDMRAISPEVDVPVTKRRILSAAHSVFDPIGFTSPVTLFPKKLLQQVWELKLGWDEDVPDNISTKFRVWVAMLPVLQKVKIPRWLLGFECAEEMKSLHVFVDASKDAYAACVFLRGESVEGVSVQLVLAKTRVAPVKTVSIPRLELLACCIGARLADSVKKIVGNSDFPTRYWTDSANALYWIRKDEQWATFVANRVKEIRMLSDSKMWSHVPGALNPADLPSRGCSSSQLLESAWWEGPEWLKGPESSWPKGVIIPDEDVVNLEKRKTVVAAHLGFPIRGSFSEELLKYLNTYSELLKTVAFILRFSSNCKKIASERTMGSLLVREIEEAEMTLVRLIQREAFGKEKEVIYGLRVFVDNAGIFRVKTKLQNREDFQNFKCPIVLPPQHKIVQMLIEETHKKMNHAGVQTVQCALRENFWIVRAKKTIKGVIRKCVKCRKFDAPHVETAPAPLPMDRVRDAAVFEITGVDLAGPLYLKGKEKAWIVLFTCAVYRAVHLELITSLSTEAFLQALRRFVARRGRPSTMYSDNGTNFVGAVNLFQSLDWKIVEEVAALRRIQWRFIPPTGAWWGGFWERLIQSVKRILKRVLGRAALRYEELLTVLCDCESVINSRPLTYISDDVDDLVSLTPAMFLQEVKEVGVADLDVLDGRGLNRRVTYLQQLRGDLRKRFRLEYLGMLTGSSRGKQKWESIQPGDIVLIGDDNQKRLDWNLAKVEAVFPGRDGVVRVARVRTAKGDLTRPVQRLYPLEVPVDQRKNLIEDAAEAKPEVFTRGGRKVKTPKRFGIDD